MGVLGVTGKTGEDHVDPPDAEAQGAPEGQPRDESGQFVPAANLQPETAQSRRERLWQERVDARIKPLQDQWNQEKTTYQQQLEEERRARQQHAEELARLRGAMEAIQSRPVQQAQQQPAGPDPDKLMDEANAALAANDIATYHKRVREATRAEATRIAEEQVKRVREEMQRSIPPQVPPQIQHLIYTHQHVAQAGERGIRAVIRMEQELEDEGMPQGYGRTQEAFKRVNEKFGGKAKEQAAAAQRPQFSQQGAAALAGIPTARTGGGGGGRNEGDVYLNEAQKAAMRAGNFKNAEEYLKWSNPRQYGLVKD